MLRNAIYELPHKTYNEDTSTLHTSSSPPPQINCPQPAMPSTLSPAELEALSTKAITAKATAYCMYRIHHSRHAIRKSANPPLPFDHYRVKIHSLLTHTHTPTIPGPYSNFRVGACILTSSGEYIIGANVENVSFPVATCAERVAFGTAVVCPSVSSQYYAMY